jgi:hypothetical protein
MSNAPADPRQSPASRLYLAVALASLLLLVAGLFESGLDAYALLPLILGALSVVLYWTMGPPLVLLSVAFVLIAQARPSWEHFLAILALRPLPRRRPFHISPEELEGSFLGDLMICVAVLGYVVAQYRLLALTRHILPLDTRRPGAGTKPLPPRLRAPGTVGPREVLVMALSLPLWAALGYLAGSALEDQKVGWLGMPERSWRIVVLLLIVAVGLIVTGVTVGYWGWNASSAEAARLYLQDQLWVQTRREQARINHWVHAARLRAQRRRERT